MSIEIIRATETSNQAFLEKYAAPGRIGLAGGDALVDRIIRRAERHLDSKQCWSMWSHAFLFEGQRLDQKHWLFESDLQMAHKRLAFGVQENPVSKYFDASSYQCLGILDFHLSAAQVETVLCGALDLLASRAQYSIRELIGTAVALRRSSRQAENRLSRKHSFYCSAFVQHLYQLAGVELIPGVHVKHSTPEDLARSPLPHTLYLLSREMRPPLAERIGRKLRHKPGRDQKW